MRRKSLGKLAKRASAFALGCAMAATTALPAFAATVPEATIDTARDGSLTLYKYDLTNAEKDGIVRSFVASGRVDADAEELYADYAIRGVEFTYLKVGEIDTCSVPDATGTAEIRVVYGIDDRLEKALGVDDAMAVASKDGLGWYLSDTLSDALAASLKADETWTKDTLEDYVLDNGGATMPETNAAGKTTVQGLDLGLYLVAETAVPEDVVCTVNPFFVSLPMTDIDGNSWNYDVVAYPKNQTGNPDLTKEVAEVTSAPKDVLVYGDTATASDGDVIAYRITSTLPRIMSKVTWLTTYTFVDELSKGISYNKGDVTLTWYDTRNGQVAKWTEKDARSMFTVSYQDNRDGSSSMEVRMTEDGLAAINPEYSRYTVVIDYRCTVHSDDSVVYGDDGNPNEVTLEWRRTNMNYHDTLKDDCIVYTYGLNLTKRFADGNGEYSNVRFVVRNKTDGYYVTASKDAEGVYYATGTVGAKEADATVFIPDSEGRIVIYGLEDDSYVATELETDAGYTLLKDDVTIVLTSTEGEHTRTGSATVNGDRVTMLEVAGSANALAPLTVVNERGYEVPSTGDTHTFVLPAAGICAAAALGAGIVLKKKKKEEV